MSDFRHRAVLALVVVLAAGAVRLGIWQLSRLSERRATNTVLIAARALPPIDLADPAIEDSVLAGRQVTATGRFEESGTIMLRNRAFRDAPGVYLVTPFLIEGSPHPAWVLRGFVNAADGVRPNRPMPRAAPGVVTITGLAMTNPTTTNGGQPLGIGSDTTWQRPDAGLLAERLPGSLPIMVLLVAPDTVLGGLPTVAPPSLDEGPHLSYAVQWFGIALAILTFGWLVVRRRDDPGPARPHAAP
ncbi:MAG TPA: SURF1 family protein [Gemmatimonadales bacterium]|nr:SURF1 family protein [Gemmatimonadales bacterium]